MRIYDNRYERERLRFQVAMRFIRLEARTRTIRLWTGLTDDRIRKLYRSYLAGGEQQPPRHRGRSPHRVGTFLSTVRLRQHTSMLAGLYRLSGAVPAPASAPAAAAAFTLALPSPARGELLCQAYEVYRALAPEPLLGFEHAVFLLTTLARANELVYGSCRDCRALVVVDRWSLRPARCAVCAAEAQTAEESVAA
ncbi:MAG TPA: hypothetical protein VHX52_06700 [Steroidobacteraceae bacterium]|jgi:hypothetical protein|nr:hypothetical protein [Steroidobacteraceae bacterium]